LSDKEDYPNAIKDFTRAIEIDSEYWYAYNNRGMALWVIGEKDSAVVDYNKVRSLIGS
ncbi:uncharacterized protein METZ01_LOCUS139057, partial [marine metagenome]